MLAGQYARAGAVRGEKVVYYGFEEPKGILLRNFASIGMPMDELERAGNLHIICRYPEAMGLEDLLVTLRMGLEEIEPALVVMDSISSIEHSSSEKGFRQFMIGLASLLREHARGALLTQTVIGSEAATHTAPYLSTIADAILALDYSVGTGELARTMRVLKMRGSSHVTYPYRLAIAQGGLQVEPPTLRPRPSGDVHRTRTADGTQPPLPGVPERPLQGLRVLVVEDFGDAREIVTTILERAGAEVTASASSSEALDRIDRQVPDLIVADIGLPHEDGIEFIRRVRARGGPGVDGARGRPHRLGAAARPRADEGSRVPGPPRQARRSLDARLRGGRARGEERLRGSEGVLRSGTDRLDPAHVKDVRHDAAIAEVAEEPRARLRTALHQGRREDHVVAFGALGLAGEIEDLEADPGRREIRDHPLHVPARLHRGRRRRADVEGQLHLARLRPPAMAMRRPGPEPGPVSRTGIRRCGGSSGGTSRGRAACG